VRVCCGANSGFAAMKSARRWVRPVARRQRVEGTRWELDGWVVGIGRSVGLVGGLGLLGRARVGDVWGVGCCRMRRRRCGGGLACVVGALSLRRCCRAMLVRRSRWVVVRGSVGNSLLVAVVVVLPVWWDRVVVVVSIADGADIPIWQSRRTTSWCSMDERWVDRATVSCTGSALVYICGFPICDMLKCSLAGSALFQGW